MPRRSDRSGGQRLRRLTAGHRRYRGRIGERQNVFLRLFGSAESGRCDSSLHVRTLRSRRSLREPTGRAYKSREPSAIHLNVGNLSQGTRKTWWRVFGQSERPVGVRPYNDTLAASLPSPRPCFAILIQSSLSEGSQHISGAVYGTAVSRRLTCDRPWTWDLYKQSTGRELGR